MTEGDFCFKRLAVSYWQLAKSKKLNRQGREGHKDKKGVMYVSRVSDDENGVGVEIFRASLMAQ
jgi:hypothetical protein